MSKSLRKTYGGSKTSRPMMRIKKKTTAQLVKSVANRQIRKLSEKKYWPLYNTVSQSNVPLLLKLSEVPQGDTDQTRDGDQLYLRSLQFTLQCVAADAYNVFRVIIFQWHDSTNSAYPTANDILIDTASYPWLLAYSHDNRFRFSILHDKRMVLDTNNPTRIDRVFIKSFKQRRIQYVGSFAVAYTNGLFALIMSDSGVATHPSAYWSIKMNFSDR